MGAEPALSIVPPHDINQRKVEAPPRIIGLRDVFSEEEQKELYKQGVEALADIALNGNDNAKTGAASKLVDLFKDTAKRGAKKTKRIRINWLNPLEESIREPEDIADLLE